MSEKGCLGDFLSKEEECKECPDIAECIMKLYDKPQPELVIYASHLVE